jgi:transcription termination factor Rho
LRRDGDRGDGGSRKPWEPAVAPAPVSTAEGEDAAGWGDDDETQSTLEPAPWGQERQSPAAAMPQTGGGVFMLEMGGFGTLRHEETNYLPAKTDIFVPQRLVQQHKLVNGMQVEGRLGRGQKHKYALNDVHSIDGKSPRDAQKVPQFRNLVTVDPDFHYAVGDASGETTMRIMDLLCPVGRGQRGLIVAPPRTGKTTLLRHFAKGIAEGYPDVHLFVLLVDERPEEATDWKRSATKAHVFASTSDESPKTHVQLAEAVWARCMRLVELGQDVVLLLDSITRLARAYNNLQGGGGKTMSGGLDSRAMERPRQIFGSARNTENAGSLTILGTALVETGSKMDQLIFEEFKGTGNMEVVLSRKLADRRIFPAIDVEKSGTRKEEKLISAKRLKSVHVLRRVLQRMNFIEAMDLLVTKLDDVERTDDFLKRFETDPEA